MSSNTFVGMVGPANTTGGAFPISVDRRRIRSKGISYRVQVDQRQTLTTTLSNQIKAWLPMTSTLDVSTRLEKLKNLSNGWLGGHGVAPNPASLDWLGSMFQSRYPRGLPLPHTYPTEEGGIQFEWLFGKIDVSLEVDLATKAGSLHVMSLDSHEFTEKAYDMTENESWADLANVLGRLHNLA